MGFFKFLKCLKKLEKIANSAPKEIHKPQCPKYNKRQDVHYHFDIDKMKFYYNGKCGDADIADFYFIPNEYQSHISNKIVLINILLKKVREIYPAIPLFQYSISDVVFERFSYDSNMVSMFCHHPYTYNGKPHITPYSVTLKFGKKNDSYFNLFYDTFGNIIKIKFVCWKKDCYVFDAKVYQKEFQIVSAYKHSGTTKEMIFDIDFMLRQQRKEEYEWICENLPELAPKTLSVYTKHKNSKTHLYSMLKQECCIRGFVIND